MSSRWMTALSNFAVCSVAVSVSAQGTGRLSAIVHDASRSSIPNAAIRLTLAGGQDSVLAAESSSDGGFTLSGAPPGVYDLRIEKAGFTARVLRSVKIDAARETTLPTILLDINPVAEVVEVKAREQTVQTANAEVSATLSTEQIQRLPVLDRNVLSLIDTQAGTASYHPSHTMINGQRTAFTQIELDGVGVQEGLLRTTSLDTLPNQLLIGQVAEVTIVSSNPSAAMGGGGSYVSFVTPSGSNEFHGNLYLYQSLQKYLLNLIESSIVRGMRRTKKTPTQKDLVSVRSQLRYEKRRTAVEAVRNGESASTVARVMKVPLRTLFSWIARYRLGGEQALQEGRRSGR
ncbi:MAG: helix-turn-helix domain-containing protein, partial [Acidimicrobiia bacterium]|nr:helix-turn-helix domain-containing protein [Acidimicrobiia bacterium]